MTSSAEWDVQSRRVLLPTRNQPTEAGRVPSIPRIGSSMYPQMYGGKLSTSFDENMSHILAKQSAKENKSLGQQPKSLMTQCSTPFEQLKTLESGFQSYQISPYKSSDDEEEEDSQGEGVVHADEISDEKQANGLSGMYNQIDVLISLMCSKLTNC